MQPKNNICVGIDFGSHSIYICVANCNVRENVLSSMQTIMNSLQKERRITPMVGLNNYQILTCDAGNYCRRKNPCGFVPFPKQYLYPYKNYKQNAYDFANHSKIVEGEDGNNAFTITNNDNKISSGKECTLSGGVILAAIFKDLKKLICKTYPSFDGSNTVVSIPVAWPAEKISMLSSSMQVAGFTGVSFVSDIEAIAMEIGYYDFIKNKLEERKTLFVDIGYTHINVFTCQYKQSKQDHFKILYCSNTTRHGAKAIDEFLTKLVVQKISRKYRISEADIMKDPRDKLTIWNACAAEKLLFTASSVKAITISCSLFCKDEEELFIEVSNDEFNRLCKDCQIVDVVKNMIQQNFYFCGEVQTILLEGSMSRLCVFSECIKQVVNDNQFKSQIMFCNNIEEDVCRGCCKYSCIRNGILEAAKVTLPSQIQTEFQSLEDIYFDEKPDPKVKKELEDLQENENGVKRLEWHLDEIERKIVEINQLILASDFSFDTKVMKDVEKYLKLLKDYENEIVNKDSNYQYKGFTWIRDQLKSIIDELKLMKENKRCGVGLSLFPKFHVF